MPHVITDMQDRSVSRMSGLVRTAVSAMCVRALCITVLKRAGGFTRDECHDLSAEKILRVKCFVFARSEFVACRLFSNAGGAGGVRKFQAMGKLVERLRDVAPAARLNPCGFQFQPGSHLRISGRKKITTLIAKPTFQRIERSRGRLPI